MCDATAVSNAASEDWCASVYEPGSGMRHPDRRVLVLSAFAIAADAGQTASASAYCSSVSSNVEGDMLWRLIGLYPVSFTQMPTKKV